MAFGSTNGGTGGGYNASRKLQFPFPHATNACVYGAICKDPFDIELPFASDNIYRTHAGEFLPLDSGQYSLGVASDFFDTHGWLGGLVLKRLANGGCYNSGGCGGDISEASSDLPVYRWIADYLSETLVAGNVKVGLDFDTDYPYVLCEYEPYSGYMSSSYGSAVGTGGVGA